MPGRFSFRVQEASSACRLPLEPVSGPAIRVGRLCNSHTDNDLRILHPMGAGSARRRQSCSLQWPGPAGTPTNEDCK
jgi:hypothetical protein